MVIALLVEPAVTVWPVARVTPATVPVRGLVSWASANDCCAPINEAVAESMEA